MALPRNLSSFHVYLLTGAMAALVFITDIFTPIGFVEWILYIAPVTGCLLSRDRMAPYFVAIACTILLAIGYVWSPTNAELTAMAAINRVIGAITLFALATVASLYIDSGARLRRIAWIQEGRVRMATAVQGENSEADFSTGVLRALADYLDAKVGVLYSLDAGRLRRVAAWALPEGERAPAEIPIGDGAIELGFLGTDGATADVIDMVQAATEGIGAGLRAAQYRTRLEALLAETKRQSEELQVQQEELRVSNEELEERSRALMDSQSRLETQQAELEQTNRQLEEYTDSLERQKNNLIAAQRALAENTRALERANQYKSEFLANMSHELRTPLNSSLILAKLLAENRHGNLTDEQIRYAQTIHSSNTDLLLLINDILDLSRIEAGHIDIQAEPVTVDSILDAMRRSFEPVAGQKQLQFRVERGQHAPEVLVTDNQRLQQILKNLLSNAFKFTETGSVTLRVAPAGEEQVRFDVVDTGIGIAPSQQGVIFEAFRQADGTTSRKYGGSGLGLSISKEFAQLLGGDITVSSEVGAGSTFSLTVAIHAPQEAASPAGPPARNAAPVQPTPPAVPDVPAQRASPAAPEAPATPRQDAMPDDRHQLTRTGRLILAIEDDLAFARILYDLAHELDFDCVLAMTAVEGMELARKLQPCGILLDMGLPDDSGLSVLERLKRDPATRHVPVHVVSVSDYTETALQLGAIGYTLKPSAREQLAGAIQSLEARLRQRLRRILVIEDDAALRGNIQLLLQSPGLEQTGVGTMADALEQLRTRSFDCVIMDLALPDGSGYDLLEKMAGDGPYAFPPVIVYTGRSLTTDEEQRLRRYSKSIIIKGARSPERLLDEVTLFLHSVESDLPPEQQRMLKEARSRDSAFEGRRILLAEDDIRNIFALSQVIEPLGAQMEIARNGREALEALARSSDIDLVLMDIMMPEMDGLTAIREIRGRPQFAKLPIIALTAKAMPADRQRCLDAGASDYISKPLDVDKLLSLCRVWLPQ